MIVAAKTDDIFAAQSFYESPLNGAFFWGMKLPLTGAFSLGVKLPLTGVFFWGGFAVVLTRFCFLGSFSGAGAVNYGGKNKESYSQKSAQTRINCG